MDDIEQRIRSQVPAHATVNASRHESSRGNITFEATISNTYLGEQRTIRAKSPLELELKASSQLAKWREKEIKDRVADARGAAAKTGRQRASEQIEALRTLLATTFSVDDRLDWNTMLDHRSFSVFEFGEPPPTEPSPSKRSFWEWLFPSMKSNRLARDADARATWMQACNDHVARRAKAQEAYASSRAAFEQDQAKRNAEVAAFRSAFEEGDTSAILRYTSAVFARSAYPEHCPVEHELSYDFSSKTLVIDLKLPNQDVIPDVVEFKERKNGDPVPVRMRKAEHDALYDSTIKQIVLRTLHEAFESVYTPYLEVTVVNGWVVHLNKATGNDKTTCLISVSAQRENFQKINLQRVDPTECLKSLKGLVAGPLSNVAPVKPIMQLDRSDGRFIDARDVLDGYDGSTNLAEIPWEDFEQLVRELFGKIFSADGAEVRVTQASRDGGVDAVAFDPDPIRGGKFVIQAKRYTNVVPVSAVRDLYGTMINEGATKGLLVTTSHFGADSHEFAKDKPLTLIDGPRLVYLLEEHGHKVFIDVHAARAARNWS